MSMGIVNDTDLNKEMENCVRPIVTNSPKIIKPELVNEDAGRNNGDRNVPAPLRALISESAQIDGRASGLELAKQFGISSSSVSAYSREVNSTNQFNQPQVPQIKNHVDRIKKNISKKARTVLRSALDNISEEKLIESKATELASIAKSMSSIITEMEPSAERPNSDAPQIVIYAPQIRSESSFEFINVSE